MITKLTALLPNYYDGSADRVLSIPFVEDGLSPFYVKGFTGLGPVKAEVSRFATPLDPGSIYLSSRDGERNIVLTVELQESYGSGSSTAAALRQQLYTVFEPGNKLDLQFDTDELGQVHIVGVVESNDPGDLTGAPVNQISIICVDPYFDDYNANISVSIDQAIAAYGAIYGTNDTFVIDFDGKVPVGFTFETIVKTALPNQGLKLYKLASIASVLTMFGANLAINSNDSFLFSSVKGNRFANYVRSGSTNSVLPWFQGSLVDMQLRPGRNFFRLENPTAMWPNSSFIKYKKRHGGL